MELNDLKKLTAGPCVITLVGSAASGKSTLARELAEGPYEIVSSDELRGMLCGNPTEQDINGVVFQMVYDIVKMRSTFQQRTIIDSTNLQRRHRKAYYGPVIKGLPSYAIRVKTPMDVCLERNASRDRNVPEFVFEKHAKQFGKSRKKMLDEYEKWTGIFEYDTTTGEVTVLR